MAKVLLGNIMGPSGPQGETGPQGPVGETGPAPVKGVDYFTEEDIQALSAYYAPATESTDYPGCYYRMVNGAQEWINPPMVADVEYLTTERWNGKPVYTKYISTFGTMPDNTSKQIALDIEPATVISIGGYCTQGSAYRNLIEIDCEAYVTAEWNLNVNTKWMASAYTAHIVLKYVKN